MAFGKNFLLDSNRLAAIAAYRFFIAYYALLGLKEAVQIILRHGRRQELGHLLVTPSSFPQWEHQRLILREELGVTDIVAALRQLLPARYHRAGGPRHCERPRGSLAGSSGACGGGR